MNNLLQVGIGELKTSTNSEEVLVAYGLGSCVGVGIYDSVNKNASLLHAMLPSNIKNDANNLYKYVDTGIESMVKKLEELGGNKRNFIVRIAGGANMLIAPGFNDAFNIGERNLKATYEKLKELGFSISGEQVGGNKGRTVRLYVKNGSMTIRKLGNIEEEF